MNNTHTFAFLGHYTAGTLTSIDNVDSTQMKCTKSQLEHEMHGVSSGVVRGVPDSVLTGTVNAMGCAAAWHLI